MPDEKDTETAEKVPAKKAPAKSDEPKHTVSQIRGNARGFGTRRHLVDGAATFHGWKPGTRLTRTELEFGITEWLKSPVSEKE